MQRWFCRVEERGRHARVLIFLGADYVQTLPFAWTQIK